MQVITTIGLDIAKSVFQVHGVDAEGNVVIRRQLKRRYVHAFFEKLPACLVGIEACASSHYWSRELQAFGHNVRLMPPAYVKPYVKRQKNDMADAEAICEAVTRANMRFVPTKTPEQQSGLMLHRTRHLFVRQQTSVINAIRAHLAEFGVIAPVGRKGIEELLHVIADPCDKRVPDVVRACLAALGSQLLSFKKQILACEEAGITVTLPKPMTSNSKAEGRFGKQDFRYVADEDVYLCPAGEKLTYRYTTEENGLVLRRYWTNACQSCAIKPTCTTGKERRITRWEHEEILEAVQRRLDEHPEKMRQRRETVEHPFGTIKARMGATHFLMKTLPKVASEMALHVLAYNLTRVMNIMGVRPLLAAMRA